MIQDILDRAVAEGGLPGIAAELRDGDERWFGTAGAPRERDHEFRIGSTTKTFVATLMLTLVADGLAGLDDPQPGGTTLRQLLSHTSGLADYLRFQDEVNQYECPTPAQLVAIGLAKPPAFPPGEGWHYSQTNYALIGQLIESITGRPLSRALGRITEALPGTYLPVGDDAGFRGPHGRHYSRLHDPSPDAETHDLTELNPSPFWAAGGMISTIPDLGDFFTALLRGDLLPPHLQDEMFTTVPTTDWLETGRYGLGISSLTLSGGETVWGMGGAIFGSWTYAYGSRDGRKVLVANTNGDWSDPIAIFTELLEAAFRS